MFINKITCTEDKKIIKLLEKAEKDKLSAIETIREKGLAEGLEKGKEEGLAEGKLENQKQIALNMKHQGFTDDIIVKCLNISINELNSLFI